MEVISTLEELGYSRRDAARAAHLADGNLDRAYGVSTLRSLNGVNINPICLGLAPPSTVTSVSGGGAFPIAFQKQLFSWFVATLPLIWCPCFPQILLDSTPNPLSTNNNNTETVSPEKLEQVTLAHHSAGFLFYCGHVMSSQCE